MSLRTVIEYGRRGVVFCLLTTSVMSQSALADGDHNTKTIRADGHGPIGVMGDHMHKKGEWMFSYRFMHMDMAGNQIGTNNVSPETIVTTVPNRFFARPCGMPACMPPTLRIVPTKMSMDMHMFGGMYAPSDNLTLMAMVNYIEKDMEHITFAGGMGTTRLGTFKTRSKGFGDTKISGLFKVLEEGNKKVHINMGLSLPTGDIEKRGNILTPMNTTMNVRLPYAMQLGSGTVDLLPGITYTDRSGDLSWGAQYRGEMRIERENSEGYRWGDKHAITGWVAYQFEPWISTSLRLDAMTQDSINGIDGSIAGPVQTANPDYFGGERVDAYFGVNLVGQSGPLRGHRLAFEIGAPIYQDLNGPQMETDLMFTVGWQKAF